MACGTPVVHSKDTSMDEITHGLATRVPALDVDAWTSEMRKLISEPSSNSEASRAKRISRAATFIGTEAPPVLYTKYHLWVDRMTSEVHVRKRALVTGGAGQDGWYLIELLLSRGYEVFAHSRRQVDPSLHAAGFPGTPAISPTRPSSRTCCPYRSRTKSIISQLCRGPHCRGTFRLRPRF